jgi:thiamine-phosphate pyrophosphorylase
VLLPKRSATKKQVEGTPPSRTYRAAMRQSRREGLVRLGRLHVIVGEYSSRDPRELASQALAGGAHVIQVRLKESSDREAFDVVSDIVSLCREKSRCCLVDDRVDVALAAEADGVHLGEKDLPVAAVRRVAGREFIIGATARDPYTARRLEGKGATYLGVGPCFDTKTKEGLPPPLGLEGLSEVCRAVKIPVIAIGGIGADSVAGVLEAGAYGIAVISAVADAPDPRMATQQLLKEVMQTVGP